ncbi:MAG: cobyrinic acid a,c-diamide synthase [Candidatus Tectimicrobiota bacterium]|nr:MAG: cobyrinic acid a,c-diamide synthase [Candidatus Tectomicrobia bacterium]
MPRLVVAGAHSGVGKTTVTVGLIAALRRRGLTVQPFKAGPDYIDPTYHTLAAGRPCRNLDTWMVPLQRLRALFARAASDADVAVIEGMMGLYDGLEYADETGSTAQLAKLLGAPVVLVLDAGQMARSAGALALGYCHFDPDLLLAGFIANRIAGESHGRGVATAIERVTGLPVFGSLPRDPALEIPERHLGLIPTVEPGRWQAFIAAAAECVARYVNLEGLLRCAQAAPPVAASPAPLPGLQRSATGPRPRLAVARDEAFNFTYPDNLDLLRAAGAEIAFFSPLHDRALPPRTAGILLSGGFPEVYARQLAANTAMHRALREAYARGIPIYAECGGLMLLTEAIVDLEGREYAMVGLLPGRSVMTGRLTLGYRVAQAASDSWLFRAGERVRGHEFHYSVWEGRPASLPPAFHLLPPHGQGHPQPEGACLGTLWASYVHLHFWSNPALSRRFVGKMGTGSFSEPAAKK